MQELTPQELADRWNITRVWLYNLKAKGRVPKFRKTSLGPKPQVLFPMDEIIKYEQKHFKVKS